MDAGVAPAPLRGLALAGATVAVAVAAFMNVLDTTIAVVALPTIAGNLAATPSQASWVVTSYGVCLAVVLPLSGWISRRYGLVHTFCTAVLLFTLTSWLCASADTFNLLLLFRALQGFAGGLLLPLSQSLLLRIYPPEKHGTALGIWAVSTAIAPVAGPLLCGYITHAWGWAWRACVWGCGGVGVVDCWGRRGACRGKIVGCGVPAVGEVDALGVGVEGVAGGDASCVA